MRKIVSTLGALTLISGNVAAQTTNPSSLMNQSSTGWIVMAVIVILAGAAGYTFTKMSDQPKQATFDEPVLAGPTGWHARK
jgi:hypothetical protein